MTGTENAPAPLTGPDCDLRDFGWMPLDVVRLRDSEFVVVASGDAFRTAVLLWCAAWHQLPAASLPNDDRLLASLAGFGRDLDGWRAVRTDALHGFVLCSDGRLYHPVVAEKAIEADSQRKKQRQRTEAAAAARRNGKRNDQRNDERNDQRDGAHDDQRNDVQKTGQEQTGQEPKSFSRSVAKATRPAVNEKFDEFWRECPRRDGPNPRKPAESRFNSLVKTGLDPQMLIDEARKWRGEEERKGNIGTRFIPQAVTWLNQQRWSDHAAVAALAEIASEPGLSLEQAVAQYAKLGTWSRYAPCGEPGSLSCTAPAELLAQYGLDAIGRKLPQQNLDDEPLEAAV